MQKITKRVIPVGILLLLMGVVGIVVEAPIRVHAAVTIVVNSVDDDEDDDGNCTLREAIIAANTNTASGVTVGECTAGDPGADSIHFNITTGSDFTSGGHDGYTITPTVALPSITETLTIDGYTQNGAEPNSNPAPQPLNGVLLIQLEGDQANGARAINIDGANDVQIRGLVIGGWDEDGISINGDNAIITGTYIGTNPAGDTANTNDNNGINGWGAVGNGARLGGTDPADRNLISGNGTSGPSAAAGGIGMGPNHNNWIIQGNYIGVAADGITPLPNAQIGGSGNPSVDFVTGTLIGGTQPGATNVISGNNGHAIAPHDADNTQIIGNYIGVAYDGFTPVGNNGSGVTMSESSNSIIRNNIVSNNGSGVYITNTANADIYDNTVADNISGTGIATNDSDGISIYDNMLTGNNKGIDFDGTTNSEAYDNTASDNSDSGISLTAGSSSVEIRSNTIYGNTTGILVRGATESAIGVPGSGNIIYDNSSYNINIFGAVAFSLVTEDITVQANTIGRTNGVNSGIGVHVTGDSSGILIGGINPGEGNKITAGEGIGVGVSALLINVMSLDVIPENVSILGNQITETTADLPVPGYSSGLGIDLFEGVDTNGPPDGNADTFSMLGVTQNDNTDPDTGANEMINFPVLHSAVQDDTTLTLGFDLDAAGSSNGDYRVELFANDTANDSGHGEGQVFLGSTTVTNGTSHAASVTLPAGTNLTGKVISATATAINTSSSSGYGGTSEFSAVLAATVVSPPSSNGESFLADTGQNIKVAAIAGALLIATASMAMIVGQKRFHIL